MIAGAVADDLTGALEVGALAAAAGIRTSVALGADQAGGVEADLLVVDAETRRPTPDREERFAAALACVSWAEPWVYVKVDSTLRGSIAAHLATVADRFPRRRLVYVPAYPAMGRTVVDGVLRVDGRELAETAFATDVHDPAISSSVIGVFSGVLPVAGIPSAEALRRRFAVDSPAEAAPVVMVCDGGTEEDLDALASVLEGSGAVMAGSGGFAARWVRMLPGPRRPPPSLPVLRRPLVVCGSRHPASLAQLDAAEQRGVPVLRPVSGRHSTGDPATDPALVAAELAARAADTIGRLRPDVVVLIGGDTTFDTLRALGCSRLDSLGEVLPGVPISRAAEADLTIVSKAGGFGADDAVSAILERLSVSGGQAR